MKKRTDKSIEDLQKLLDKAKKVADVKESIVNAYPFSISLSDENFAKFAALNINQKNKVNQYIVDHAIIDVRGINECWMTPLIEEKRSKILDVEAVEDDGKDDEEKKDDKDDKDSDSKEKSDKEKSDDKKDKDSDDVAECDDAAKEDASCQTTKDKEEKEKILNDNDKSGEEVKKRTDKSIEDLQKLLDKAKKVADVKESIVNAYPFSISLSDENFAKFAALNINQKNKVNQYIVDHAIIDVRGINECWMTPLIEEKRQLKNWLRLASEEDKKLFVDAPKDVQDAIEESAKYVMINTKADAERFWKSTGLRQRHAQQMLAESMSGRYELSEENKQKVETIAKSNELGYSMDYFKMVEDMYCYLNK